MKYPTLPPKAKERTTDTFYTRKENETVFWNGKKVLCEHKRKRSTCKDCGGVGICQHNRVRKQCKDCGGSSICEHKRQRHNCKECGGANICVHSRQRTQCKECGGSQICEHNRERRWCKDCGGSGICEHKRQRHNCKECGGSNICEHSRQRTQCKECKPKRDISMSAAKQVEIAIAKAAKKEVGIEGQKCQRCASDAGNNIKLSCGCVICSTCVKHEMPNPECPNCGEAVIPPTFEGRVTAPVLAALTLQQEAALTLQPEAVLEGVTLQAEVAPPVHAAPADPVAEVTLQVVQDDAGDKA